MTEPNWDELEDDLFELPPDIAIALTASEVAKVDQLIATAKTLGHHVMLGGGNFEDAIDAMADCLLELMEVVEAALTRYEKGE